MVYSTRRFVVYLTLCHFLLVFFSPFGIAITSLGEERANLGAFRTFDRFVLVWIYRFPLPLGVCGGGGAGCGGCGLWHSLDFSLTFFHSFTIRKCNKSITVLEDFTFQLDSPKQFLSLIRIYTGCFSVLDFDWYLCLWQETYHNSKTEVSILES